MTCYALQARWLFPITSPPIEHGVISIANDRIVAVGENVSGSPPHHLGEVAILPGLINSHTHLEFSELTEPLGPTEAADTPEPFPQWIERVIAYRQQHAVDVSLSKSDSITQGLTESQQAGVSALGEIATLPHSPEPYANAPENLCGTLFLELLGLAPDREVMLIEAAREHLAATSTEPWRLGLSPHAPYTASPQLVSAAVRLAGEFNAPVAMHLAESREEMELLATGGGPLVQFLEQLGAWRSGVVPLGSEPLDYLQLLAHAPRALVVHGNYLVEEELQFLAEHRTNMTLVYCPRTHARFGHPTYPLVAALAAGVRVALGTDSRASNPDLSLFRELQFVAEQFPQVSPDQLLAMATINGAEALGLHTKLGSLEAGKMPHLAMVKLGDTGTNAYERLLHAGSDLVRFEQSS